MRRRPLLMLAVLALGSIAPSCGSSPSAPPMTRITFNSGVTPLPLNSIGFAVVSATTTSLTLNVDASSVAGVASIFFDLVFNPAVFQFQSATLGPFLGTSGASAQLTVPTDPALLAAANATGRLPVSVTVVPATLGASGSGVVCTVTLRYVMDGTSPVAFERTGALQPFPGQPVPGLTFVGGSASAVTR